QIAADNTEICYGTNVTFTAVPTNGGLFPAYQWIVNGQPVGNGETFSSNALNDGDKVTCVMTSNATICQVNTTAASNSIPLIVHPALSPAITISSGSLVYLENSTVTFTASAVNYGAVPAFQWHVNGLNVGTNSATYVTGNLADGDEVSCTLTSNAPCVINANAASNKLVIKIIAKVFVPNTFTPNGDGINDTWDLQGIAAYPQCVVSIFSRYGQPVFQSVGYGQAWNGSYNGRPLSPGTYYYVIKLDSSQTISGSVTILR
ncbi:MAG: gliding motility-associated C-terminal domain-containing protein, partial [Mucilaginibacter sp.]